MGSLDVTLVIPVLNEELALPLLVASIEGQSVQPGSVVFVDGGSEDATVPVLKTVCGSHVGWRLIEFGAGTPGRGRNCGIASAETEWVALADAGTELDVHWLKRLVRVAVANRRVEVVYGHYEPHASGFFSTCAALAYVGAPSHTDRGPARVGSVASMLLRRDLWGRAGGFPDLRAAEDLLFMRQLDALGSATAVAPEARVTWQLAPGFRATFRRFRTYSRVNVEIGEQRNWHYGVARIYLAWLLVALMPIPRRWRAVLCASAGLARVERGIWQRREGRGVLWAINPARVAGVAAVLLTVDAGTFAGWADAILGRRRRAD